MATKTRRLADLLANIDDNSKVTSAGLLDATITAADLADDSVGTAEIIDDAVTAAAIADGAIDTAAKLGSNVVTSAKILDNNVTGAKIAADTFPVKPHIQPGMLYPAYKGKLSDGVTAHSGNYGTAQSDGFSYYYTDINGSKPIKDPRIGAHFGSQRHMFKSGQLLEQETAMSGADVYSIDGRNWIRKHDTQGGGFATNNDGMCVWQTASANDTTFWEVTGYFNGINWIGYTYPHSMYGFKWALDGSAYTTNNTAANSFNTAQETPLKDRHVDAGSLLNIPLSTTLGIHTFKFSFGGAHYGCELIAQDQQEFTATNATNILTSAGHILSNGDQVRLTGSDLPNGLNATTTYFVVGASGNNFQVSASFGGAAVTFSDDGTGSRTFTALNNIQIPAQNVVSYGKKFSVSATAQHYNPFATKGDGSVSTIPSNTTGDSVATGWAGSTSAYWDSSLDTATSLGLAAWVSGGNYYRPVNGGRVVKWIDSSGNIKTSVNMMPPEAHAFEASTNQAVTIGAATGSCAATGTHNWATQHLPQFGNKTVGSNLWTAMADNGSYPFETRPGGGLNGAWNNTTGYGLAYVAVSLTIGKLYRLRWDASSVSGVTSYIGTALNSSATNWKNKRIIANGTNRTSVFRADADTAMIVMHTGNGAAAFTLANMTLYELEEPESQAEIAKSFHFREFGNGSANGGTTAADPKADISMLGTTADNVNYVMDDGTTSMTGDDIRMWPNNEGDPSMANNKAFWFTFIGTGVSVKKTPNLGTAANAIDDGVYAQNLPYGSHVFYCKRVDGSDDIIKIDGVQVHGDSSTNGYLGCKWWNVHQPKKPPIPDDACVIADYMLMADFVKQTTASLEGQLSKGTRALSASRDMLYDSGAGITLAMYSEFPFGLRGDTTHANAVVKVPFFGTNSVETGYGGSGSYRFSSKFNGTASSGAAEVVDAGTWSSAITHNGATLGVNTCQVEDGINNLLNIDAFYLASPIHTSSHYQEFETPHLKEIVGGDRNMEQTNLVITADGKTWDQVTRDTSYIGNCVVKTNKAGANSSNNTTAVDFKDWRGSESLGGGPHFNKDFAISYNKLVCLVDGQYSVHVHTQGRSGNEGRILINGTQMNKFHTPTNDESAAGNFVLDLKRGDWISWTGVWSTYRQYQNFIINRI